MQGYSDIDPHANQDVLTAGRRLEAADAAIILLHGRGADAEGMIKLFRVLEADGFAAIAPRAAGNSWYPYSFLAPMENNQPFLDSALNRIESLVGDLMQRGFEANRVALLGFSQGACLASEFTARQPRAYGAVMALTGGLIGPPGTRRDYSGSLAGTNVFLGAGDPDAHVPFERVRETRDVLIAMGARVELRRYAGMPHTINDEELDICRAMLRKMLSDSDEK